MPTTLLLAHPDLKTQRQLWMWPIKEFGPIVYKAEIHKPFILLRRLNLTLLLQNQAESTNSLYDLQLLLRWYILVLVHTIENLQQ